jgi:hypothetical protein
MQLAHQPLEFGVVVGRDPAIQRVAFQCDNNKDWASVLFMHVGLDE